MIQVLNGDALDQLRTLPDESVQCCVTSPPYWGLRDYGVDGQIGLEPTPEAYVARIIPIFREVRRVLRNDGTLWLNLGDTYATKPHGSGSSFDPKWPNARDRSEGFTSNRTNRPLTLGLKHKDLVGIPWLVAFALRADGWWLRSEIIWHKSNPMPESATDRPTKSHEQVFLLSKSSRYYYDLEAVREPCAGTAHARGTGVNPKAKWKTPDGWDTSKGKGGHGSYHREGREKGSKGYKPHGKNSRMNVDRDAAHLRPKSPRQNPSFSAAVSELVEKRNKRSVWRIATAPYRGAHFATFPPKLIEPCILAGSRVGDVVLDPFAGSGTTGQVAREHGRSAILIELNPSYIELINRRTSALAA